MGTVRRLWRPSVTLVALFATGFLGIFGYARATRTETDEVPHTGATTTTAPPPGAQSNTASPDKLSKAADQSQPSQPTSADAVEKWAADAVGNDAKARATAIAALAKAPRAQALPALKRVLKSGDSQVDRPLALGSLRTLALDQGDADNQIREVLREAVYHGDDDTFVSSVQATLDEVEQIVSGRRPR